MLSLNSELLQKHYKEHLEKDFYEGLEKFMKSSPVVVMAWEGYECVNSVRLVVGDTNPRRAEAGTVRGDMAIGTGRNLIHASDSKHSGEGEVKAFFGSDELFEYEKSEYLHIYEPHERK
jgi:nucleoside-diphosphate kinase